MFRKIYLTIASVLISILSFAQTGTLKGVVTNTMTGEPIPFANLIIERNGNQQGGTATDFDGNYTIKPIEPGTYTIKATCVGFGTIEVTGVIISANKITFQDIKLQEGIAIGEIKIIEYKKPLLDQDNLSGETKTSEEIVALPTRSVASVAASTAGIYQEDEGDDVNIRGSRDNATTYYIDGIKVRGAKSVPTSSIEQITVVTGGLSAKYGDATGGIISITTKGPSSKTFGSVEFETSSLFDDYNYNLLGWTVSGPIYKRNGKSVIGYFLSGEARSVDDQDPSAIGMWKVTDEKLSDLKSNPLIFLEQGGIKASATFLEQSDFENVQAKLNSNDKRLSLQGKLDFKPTKNTFLTIGGSYFMKGSNEYGRWYSMMNADNNHYRTENTYRFFGKITQKFGSEESNKEASSSSVKNVFLTIQGDYTNYSRTGGDADNKDKLFQYGYVGKFETYKAPTFQNGSIWDSINKIAYTGQMLTGWADTLLMFEGSDINPDLRNYTDAYYDLFAQEYLSSFTLGGAYGNDGVIRTQGDLQGIGLTNGMKPASVYSLYANNGDWYSYYWSDKKTQTTFKASGSADIKDHELSFGFEFEQRKDAYWQFNTYRNLWGLMRQQTNKHILELDLSKPLPVYSNGVYQDTVEFNRLFVESEQSTFDKNLRDKLMTDGVLDIYGNPIDTATWIDIDRIDPSYFSIEMFSPDELLNNSTEYAYYYGYDIYGNELVTNPTLKDFFEEEDKNGNKTRKIAAFQPIYTAGYIQDKFAIEDLIFNIGLRIDRYDANQKVLKDKYLLYPAYTRGTELSDPTNIINTTNHPSNIGSDYVIYADDVANPSTIVGYRDGDDWYDATGRQISDPTLLSEAAGGAIAPYLGETVALNAASGDIGASLDEVFEDYTPELIFMPRIAFSFPISDEAQFFAHYDVLTQRPPSYNRLDPVGYLFLANDVGATINNPNLKPERTIDYELGFAKTLSLRSALKISAFYKEMRDMITKINVISAYPAQYYSYGNLDFGTVKGFSINYDLRRTNNVQLGANYTLQFADGTGSETDGDVNLVETGQPNLRTTIPLDFDQRHSLSATVDYRYGSGKDYNGPVWFGMKVLQNAGANIRMDAGSGTPYSRQSNITQEAASGINDRSTLSGSLNGSRLPWQFKLSAKLNKEFEIKWNDKKSSFVNIYVQVQNLLNAQNVINVYRATGNPEDDGYLTAAASQNAINAQNDPDAFRTLYTMKVNNPSNYAMPRMWRAGLSIEF
tara:strand:- start:2069 stop:5791 length:3723 start_codon:yes stop_codon:yes gene_type:complete